MSRLTLKKRRVRKLQNLTKLLPLALSMAVLLPLSACNTSGNDTKSAIQVVAAENEYGNIASQIGGKYVSVTSIMSNPNTDPHEYEASASTATLIANAQIVIQNGVGYDSFINKLESASPNTDRVNLNVQNILHLSNSTENPHLWYNPYYIASMSKAFTKALINLAPSHRQYFIDNENKFLGSLRKLESQIATFKSKYKNAKVATTEPVADYLLTALGIDNLTPWSLQATIMNGIDPSPEAVSFEENLFSTHKVNLFVYNQQVTTSLTQSFVEYANKNSIPIVGVYETMPTPGYNYQTWMGAEIKAIQKALTGHLSTTKL
ncbi:MAG: zinc ABC transporter substrate-binding protein [Firmicutes bacterium]|nr:zinc ABC transporter substrate-binding protein [Bacillota bacterium]